MGYLFLFIALIAGVTKGYCGKKTSGFVSKYKDAMLANSLRMFLCVAIGLGMIIVNGGVSGLKINSTTLLITLLSGVANSAFVVLWLIAVKNGAYMMLDVFCMLGILIPMGGCALMFDEVITAKHAVGIIILLTAVCVMCSYNNSIKSKMTFSSLILLFLCGISNGISDFSQKLFVKLSDDIPIATFNFYTYMFSWIILSCCYYVFWSFSDKKTKTDIKPISVYILIMSVCLFLYSYFKTVAARYLPASQLYPLAQGGSLILSSIMSAVFFRERINIKCVVGIAMSFVALIIINVL